MSPELLRIASRVVWWDTPERVLAREDDFLCRVMALGNLADVNYVQATYGTDRLRRALRTASPGILDPRSWHYWHHRLGLGPAGPQPTRAFLQERPSMPIPSRDARVSSARGTDSGNATDGQTSGRPVEDNGVRVASLLDLAAQKVRVVQVRAERKDYLDLMTLLANGITLPAALGAAQALYGDFAPLITLKALSYFGDGDLGALPGEVKRTLSDAAAAVHTPTPVARLSERLSESA